MLAGIGGEEMAPLGELGDGWGRVDLTAFEDLLPAGSAANLGGQGADPSAFLDLLEDVGHVEELGSETQDGVALTGYAADVSLADMMDAQGMAPEDMGSLFGAGGEEIGEAVLEVEIPIEVWVDGEGYVRRMVMEIGGPELLEAVESIEDVPAEDTEEVGSVVVETDMRFNDFGYDVTIAV